MKNFLCFFICLTIYNISYGQSFNVGEIVTIKINNVEIYKSPEDENSIIYKMTKQDEAMFLGENKNSFSKIKIKNMEGWIDSSFLVSSTKDNFKQTNTYKKIDNWIFTANAQLSAKANSNIIKILEDNGQTKSALIGHMGIEIYRGVLLAFKDSINDISIKEFKKSLDKIFPFKMGKNTYNQYIAADGKKFSIYISVELETIIDTPIGKREVYLIETIVQDDNLDIIGKSKTNFDRRTTWVDKEMLIPWGRRTYGDLYGEAFIGRGGFYITEVSGN